MIKSFLLSALCVCYCFAFSQENISINGLVSVEQASLTGNLIIEEHATLKVDSSLSLHTNKIIASESASVLGKGILTLNNAREKSHCH